MSKIEIARKLGRAIEFYEELGFKYLPVRLAQKSKSTKVQKFKSEEVQESSSEILNPESEIKGPALRPQVSAHGDKVSALKELREEIGDCQRCKLCQKRKNIVFGEGSSDAKLMFIGEGPGRDEDIQARPFVGEAGQLLTKMIEKMGLKRGEVYIANIVKCRPPNNREPEADEIATCRPFVEKQIEIIKPEVIVSLGKVASHALLNVKTPISRLRGNFSKRDDIPLMPTFHPAYLLRNPKDKWLTWDDMQKVLEKLKS
ncbi:MAG: uracil-DNA glycosylase [Nitrospirae bacterium]|nr:uracil-DNA glycosylase [Nitrospirota bacterium]